MSDITSLYTVVPHLLEVTINAKIFVGIFRLFVVYENHVILKQR